MSQQDMAIEGIVVGGRIELDTPLPLPEGTRVRIEAIITNIPSPFKPYDRERELALLREAHEDVKAGHVRPFDEFMAELAAKTRAIASGGQ